jgi:hypothetical protein
MGEPGVDLENRDAAVGAFDRAHAGFIDAYRSIPDEALTFVPQGEDYTLGGLVVHVMDVIDHYTLVLNRMIAAGFGEVRVIDPDDQRARRDALIRDGYGSTQRDGVFAELDSAHREFVTRIRGLSATDYLNQAPVLYGADAVDPFSTRAADIMGWLIDHYNEHITQSTALLADWQRTQGSRVR